MKIKNFFLVFAFLLCSVSSFGRDKKMIITTSEVDAVIFADGKQVGVGSATVVVPAYGQVTIKVAKLGFITFESTYYNGSGKYPPKSYHVDMIKEGAAEALTISDKTGDKPLYQNKIIITTTDLKCDYDVIRVVGTTINNKAFVSFNTLRGIDLFDKYLNQGLESLEKIALSEGANAIIGVNVMYNLNENLTIYGTAVKIKEVLK